MGSACGVEVAAEEGVGDCAAFLFGPISLTDVLLKVLVLIYRRKTKQVCEECCTRQIREPKIAQFQLFEKVTYFIKGFLSMGDTTGAVWKETNAHTKLHF